MVELLLCLAEGGEDLLEGGDLLGEEHRFHGGIVAPEFREATFGREEFQGAGDGCFVVGP